VGKKKKKRTTNRKLPCRRVPQGRGGSTFPQKIFFPSKKGKTVTLSKKKNSTRLTEEAGEGTREQEGPRRGPTSGHKPKEHPRGKVLSTTQTKKQKPASRTYREENYCEGSSLVASEGIEGRTKPNGRRSNHEEKGRRRKNRRTGKGRPWGLYAVFTGTKTDREKGE